MSNSSCQLKCFLIIFLIFAPTPLESMIPIITGAYNAAIDGYNQIRFVLNPVAGGYAQGMLERRFNYLLEIRDKKLTEYMRWQISNISHLYLLKLIFDKQDRELDIPSTILYMNGALALCATLKIRFEHIGQFKIWKPIGAVPMEIEKPNPNDLESAKEIIGVYSEFIQEANFIMFSQFFFNQSSIMRKNLIELKGTTEEMKLLRSDLYEVFGQARLTQLRFTHPQYFTKIFGMDDNEIIGENYAEYFRKEENYAEYFRKERIFAKWRHKQVIEFFLYREWETNNSQEQPEDGWKATELWKPFIDYYWEGNGDKENKQEWEKIFLFPREYAKEQIERPNTLEAARVCTLKTQKKLRAQRKVNKNSLNSNNFWTNCLPEQLKNRRDNLAGQRRMHAQKMVELLRTNESAGFKEAVDAWNAKSLKELIGMTKKELYARVEQMQDSKHASSSSTILEASPMGNQVPESSKNEVEEQEKIKENVVEHFPTSEPSNNEIEEDVEVRESVKGKSILGESSSSSDSEAEFGDLINAKNGEKSKTSEIHVKSNMESKVFSPEAKNAKADDQKRLLEIKKEIEMIDNERLEKLSMDDKPTKATIAPSKRGKKPLKTSIKKPPPKEIADLVRQKAIAGAQEKKKMEEMENEKVAAKGKTHKMTTA